MPSEDAAAALARFLEEEADRVARRWARQAQAEPGASQEPARTVTRRFADMLVELRRLLGSRGVEGIPVWGESIRRHGGDRFGAGAGAARVVRELDALRVALGDTWVTRYGEALPPKMAELIGDVVAAGCAGCVDGYVQKMRLSRSHLREEAAIQSILAHMVEGLLAVEADGTVSFVTSPAARVLGLGANELVGASREESAQVLSRLALRDEQGRPIAPEQLPYVEALVTHQPVRGRWLRLRRPSDGEERVVQTDAIPIFQEGGEGEERGELRGVVATFRDRTQEYKQRAALATAYEELQRLHLSLLGRSRLQAMGDLAASVAGVLNNALNKMHLHCSLALGLWETQGPPAEHCRAIEATIDEVAQVVTRLQELAVPQGQKRPEPVALDGAVRDALALVRPELAAAARGRELRVALDLSTVSVFAPPSDVRELVVQVLLQAAAGSGEVKLATHTEAGWATLEVSGLEAGALQAVQESATAWAGRVTTRNGTLAVMLPLAPELVAGRETTRSAAPHKARTVLLVEDDADQRETLAAVLEDRGVRVVQAATAAEADAKREDFEAALVDLALPDASGWDIVVRLRQRLPGLRAAVVTGYEAGPPERRPDAAVDAVFHKPLHLEDLFRFLGLDGTV